LNNIEKGGDIWLRIRLMVTDIGKVQ